MNALAGDPLRLGKEKTKKRFKPASELRGRKVLVVDDNATSRSILQDMLGLCF